MSIFHWLVVIFAGYILIFFIRVVSRSRVRSRLFVRAERKVYVGAQTPLDEPKPGFIALPYLLSFWALVILLGLTLPPTVNLTAILQPDKLRQLDLPMVISLSLLFNVLNLCGVALVLSGILLHLRPNHSRQLKYSLVMACMPLWLMLFLPNSVLEALKQSQTRDGHSSFMEAALLLGAAFWGVIVVVVIAVLGGVWIRHCASSGRKPPSPLEQLFFTFVRMRCAGPIIILCYFLSKDVMLILLMIRYLVIERFRQQPIVYLRSFHHQDAAEVFGRAIAPAIARFGVVKALVHTRQTGGALLSKASIWQFGLMATAPDEHWQDWVTEALRTARLVIIDCSILTDSVKWEVDAALQHVKRQCVLVITDDQAPIGAATDTEIVFYGQGPKWTARLESNIAAWAEWALPGRPSKFLPMAALAWFCVLLVASADLGLAILSRINSASN